MLLRALDESRLSARWSLGGRSIYERRSSTALDEPALPLILITKETLLTPASVPYISRYGTHISWLAILKFVIVPLCRRETPVDIQSARNLITREVRDFGLGATIYDLSIRAVNHVVAFTFWKGVVANQPHPDYLRLPEAYQARLLEADAMSAYVGPENELEEEVLEQARAKGDRCMALFDGATLASYGWYSNQPTDISDDLQLHFKSSYVYMYKGFTSTRFRGQRLHAIGMTLALQEYLRRGFSGIVSVVASHNLSSLKSCYRMGYRDFGRIYVLKSYGRHFLYHSGGCRDFEFSLQPKPSTETRRLKMENKAA